MKRIFVWCLLGLTVLACFAFAIDKNSSAEKAVADLENKWMQSQKTNNPDMIAGDLSDKMVYTSIEGKVADKAGLLKMAKDTNYSSVEYKDLKVTVFGDAAVATGTFLAKGTDNGKAFDDTERFTDTWVKSGGKWQCVATQSTTIAK